MMDLAEYLQSEVDKDRSLRKTAARLHISKTTLDKIIKRKIKTMPQIQTLQNIADYTGLTLPVVVEMAGAVLGDTEKYSMLARELEWYPWITEEWRRLTNLTREELKESLDYVEWRRRHPGGAPLPRNDGRSNP